MSRKCQKIASQKCSCRLYDNGLNGTASSKCSCWEQSHQQPMP